MKKIFLLSIFIYLFLSMPVASYADSDKIEDIPSSLDTPEINYNRGVINYRKNDFEKAAGLFNRALISADKSLEAKASYNFGNCEYKLGKSKEKENLAETVKLLREALQYYKRSIELDQKNNDAKFNYELTEKELKVLEEKLKQQKGKSENKKQKDEGRGTRDEEKNQEEQSAEAQQEKDQEEKQQESQAQETSQEKKEQAAKEEQAQETTEPKEMSKEEAKVLLEGYRQEENALGEVKEKRRASPSGVLKDW
ncbi:MAG: hypothetical protein ABIH18_08010 [Candidatus Omnitrophota bacterium]